MYVVAFRFLKCINCCKLSSICCINLNILVWQLSLITARIILDNILVQVILNNIDSYFCQLNQNPTADYTFDCSIFLVNFNFYCYLFFQAHQAQVLGVVVARVLVEAGAVQLITTNWISLRHTTMVEAALVVRFFFFFLFFRKKKYFASA